MKSVPSAPQEAALVSNKQNRSYPSHTDTDQLSTFYDDADLYDCLAWGHCEPFYFDAASRCGGPVLELACGTGRMLVPMAKAGLDVTLLDAAGLAEYAAVCGEMLARGHGRSGNASLIAGYVRDGNAFGEAILHFAKAYAQQTTLDWKALLATI